MTSRPIKRGNGEGSIYQVAGGCRIYQVAGGCRGYVWATNPDGLRYRADTAKASFRS